MVFFCRQIRNKWSHKQQKLDHNPTEINSASESKVVDLPVNI